MGQRRVGIPEDPASTAGIVIDADTKTIDLVAPAGININGAPLAGGTSHTHSGAYGRQPSTYKAGWYLSHPGPASTTIPAEATLLFMPLIVPKDLVADRIAGEVTTVGTIDAVVRLGIYAANADGIPDALILDAGTIDGLVAATQAITINQALPAGLVFLAAAVHSSGTRPTIRNRTGAGYLNLASNLVNAVSFSLPGYLKTGGGVPGALPASAGVVEGATYAPSLGIRVV